MSLSWTAGKDVVWTKVLRAPGPKTAKSAVVYQGRKHAFLDKKLRTGTRYWYEVTLVDRAGNESVEDDRHAADLARGRVGGIWSRPRAQSSRGRRSSGGCR